MANRGKQGNRKPDDRQGLTEDEYLCTRERFQALMELADATRSLAIQGLDLMESYVNLRDHYACKATSLRIFEVIKRNARATFLHAHDVSRSRGLTEERRNLKLERLTRILDASAEAIYQTSEVFQQGEDL